MVEQASDRARAIRIAVIQGSVLVVLCLLACWKQAAAIFDLALHDRESAHLLAAPAVVGLLAYRRRRALAKAFSGPNTWGLVVIGVAIFFYAILRWPFNFAYPRRISIVAALAGAVLAVGGRRVLRLSVPMLLVLLVAIPITPRHYARMIILPETVTLRMVQTTLDLLPGVLVELEGPDLSYFKAGGEGTIALGEPYRGASLFLAYLTLGLFVAFVRIRPWWQLAVLALAAGPVLFLCNYLRLLIWGLLTIWTGAGPLNAFPRVTASVLSMALAWGMFAGLALCLAKIIQSAPSPEPTVEGAEEAPDVAP